MLFIKRDVNNYTVKQICEITKLGRSTLIVSSNKEGFMMEDYLKKVCNICSAIIDTIRGCNSLIKELISKIIRTNLMSDRFYST